MPLKNKNRKKKNTRRLIFVLSGPGGAGKTTLLNKLFRRKIIRENFLRTISFTTRQRRPGEKDGIDYFFINKDEFLELRRKNFFLESQKVLNDYYGTPKYFYEQAKKSKRELILCIDVKGTMYLKRKRKLDKIITVFISAPQKELYYRLRKRTEVKSMIKKRISLAKKELQFSKDYDYLIINRDLKTTLKNLEEVLFGEKIGRKNG